MPKPNCPVLSKKDYELRVVSLQTARNLIEEFHYAKGGSNTAVYCHGLFRKAEPLTCLGVAWWLPPTKVCAQATYPEGDWQKVLSLTRLAVNPEVPQNGASFLIGQSIKWIIRKAEWECLVTFADTYQCHSGAIYKATNWEDLGLTEPTPVWVDEDGRMVARKAGPKTRTDKEMVALGYRCIGKFPKHKYRMLLPRIKEEPCRGLLSFTLMGAKPARSGDGLLIVQ